LPKRTLPVLMCGVEGWIGKEDGDGDPKSPVEGVGDDDDDRRKRRVVTVDGIGVLGGDCVDFIVAGKANFLLGEVKEEVGVGSLLLGVNVVVIGCNS
jgi:hypothetical protein